jgi:hypothetical protein
MCERDQRAALADQCLHLAEADVPALKRCSGFDPNRNYRDLLFDHLVGAQHEPGWNVKTDRLRGLKIDNQLEPGRLLDR